MKAQPAVAQSEIRPPLRTQSAILLGTFFGIGYFPMIPGTIASAVTAAAFGLLWPAALSPLWLLAGAAALLMPAIWASGQCESQFGVHDPGRVVVDEVLGQAIALAAVPAALAGGWKYSLLGFILFRVFDIVKPFPAGAAERLPGGWGVVLDDCWAGVYAFGSFRLILWIW